MYVEINLFTLISLYVYRYDSCIRIYIHIYINQNKIKQKANIEIPPSYPPSLQDQRRHPFFYKHALARSYHYFSKTPWGCPRYAAYEVQNVEPCQAVRAYNQAKKQINGCDGSNDSGVICQ